MLARAQKHVEQQGGVLSAARQELGRLESQLDQASERAREKSRAGEEPHVGDTSFELSGEEETATHVDKGKARADDAASAGAASLGELTGSVWSTLQRFAHHEQVQKLQQQMAALVHSGDGEKSTEGEIKEGATRSALPAFREVEALAGKYLEAGEGFAREMGRDLGRMLDEVVKIVPPEEEKRTEAQAAAPAEKTTLAQATEPITDDFSWDADEDEFDPAEHESTAPSHAPAHTEAPPAAGRATETHATQGRAPAPPPAGESDSDWE